MDDCPVCLEPLTGTIVKMGCCRNQVHIQCYVTKCPFCRAALPPPRPAEVIVPVPVPVQVPVRHVRALAIFPVVVATVLVLYVFSLKT